MACGRCRLLWAGLAAWLALAVACPVPAGAWYPRRHHEALVPAGQEPALVGRNRSYLLGEDETLIELAYRAGLGYQGLVAANPGVDPWLPPAGTLVLLPYAALLPAGAGPGITINLAEYRLYLVWEQEGQRLVRIYPIGIGDEGTETQEGDYQVTGVVRNPSWTVPPSIRAKRPELPPRVPPGPDNPLGDIWVGLSLPGVGIHGTNKPFGIGRRVSHGCIRLYPEDVADLAERVGKGMPVRILYQPIKLGRREGRLLAEIHADYLGRVADPLAEAKRQVTALGWPGAVDEAELQRVLGEARGIPLPVAPP